MSKVDNIKKKSDSKDLPFFNLINLILIMYKYYNKNT